MRSLCMLALISICAWSAGSAGAAGIKDGTDAGVPGKHDIYGVDVAISPPPGPPVSPDDKTITIKICMAACPPCDATTSLTVKIGGAKIRVFCSGWWQYQRMPKGGSSWFNPETVEETFTTGPWGVPQPDGTPDATSVCCITIVVLASELGLPIPTGKAAYEVTSHNSGDGTGTPVDTASGGYTKW